MPYRTVPEAPARPAPPRELAYRTQDAERYAAPRRTMLQSLIAAAAVMVVSNMLDALTMGGIVAAVCVGAGILRALRAPDLEVLTFRVEDGELCISSRGKSLLDMPLQSLLQVELDTKQISRSRRDTRVAMGVLDGTRMTVDPEVDVARIVLVPMDPRDPVTLTDAYVSHMEAVEWASKIRVFLRAHGWLPEDERDDA